MVLPLISLTTYDSDIANAYATVLEFAIIFAMLFFVFHYIIFPIKYPHIASKKELFYASNSAVSLIHSTFFLALIAKYANGGNFVLLGDDKIEWFTMENLLVFKLTAAVAVGYFAQDSLLMVFYEYYYTHKVDYVMLLHHFVSGATLFALIHFSHGGFLIMHVKYLYLLLYKHIFYPTFVFFGSCLCVLFCFVLFFCLICFAKQKKEI